MSFFKPQILISALQLLAGVILIQWHAVGFWTEYVDEHTGWALSIMIEVIALSFWWSRHVGYRFLALTATVVLLAGPTYDLGKPVYAAIQDSRGAGNVNNVELAALKLERDQLQDNLQSYREGTKLRGGFAKHIDAATEQLQAVNRQIVAVESDTTTTDRIEWEAVVPVGMYIWVLLLVQINNVRMVRLLAQSRSTSPRRAFQPSAPAQTDGEPIRLERRPFGRLGVRLRGENLGQLLN